MNHLTLELIRLREIEPFEGHNFKTGKQTIEDFFQVEKLAQLFVHDWCELWNNHVSFQKAIFSVIAEKDEKEKEKEKESYATSITIINSSPNIQRCKFQCSNVHF